VWRETRLAISGRRAGGARPRATGVASTAGAPSAEPRRAHAGDPRGSRRAWPAGKPCSKGRRSRPLDAISAHFLPSCLGQASLSSLPKPALRRPAPAALSAALLDVAAAGVDVVGRLWERKRDGAREQGKPRFVPDERRLVVAADSQEPLDACPGASHARKSRERALRGAGGGLPAAAAELDGLAGPGRDASVKDRSRVDTGSGQHARGDRRARAGAADRDDWLAAVHVGAHRS
jgi:hypothetical protein